MSSAARLKLVAWVGSIALAFAASAAGSQPTLLVDILEDLRASGSEVLFSSDLVPSNLEVNAPILGVDPKSRAIEALAQHQLTLVEMGLGRYLVTRAAPHAAPPNGRLAPAKVSEFSSSNLDPVSVYASRYALEWDPLHAPADLTSSVIAHVPGSQNDALHAMRALPGLASNVSSRPYIRGSGPDDVLLQFDGVPLIDPFHFKDFQSLISAFDASAVDRIEVYSSGFPARYGTRSGGVIDITPRTLQSGYEVSFGASLLANTASSVGRASGWPIDWLVTVRNSIHDITLKPVNGNVGEPQFTDSLGRVRWQVSRDTALIAGWLLLNDRIHLATDPAQEAAIAHYRDEYGWLRLEQTIGDRWRSNTYVSAAHGERSRSGAIASPGIADGAISETRRFASAELHSDWTYHGPANGIWSAGLDAAYERADVQYLRTLQFSQGIATRFARSAIDNASSSVDPSTSTYGLFGSVRHQWGSMEAELGLRIDAQHYVDTGRRSQWSPRLNFRYDASQRWKVYGSWGRFTQAQHPYEWRVEQQQSVPDPSALSIHSVIGLSYQPSEVTSWRVEAYRKRWTTLAPYFDNLLNTLSLVPDLQPDRVFVVPVDAESSGIEISARHRLSDATEAWINYSWSRVADEFPGGDVLRSWDQPHALSVGATWKRAPMELSMLAAWHRGWPRTAVGIRTTTAVNNASFLIDSRNTARWGDFVSLDFRASWTLPFRRSELSTWVELTNSSNRRNECCAAFSSNSIGGNTVLDQGYWLPRVLNAGATWRFRSTR